MVVYGDLLFLINFSMDFLCFYISLLLLHQKLPLFRMCLSSFVGGVYSVIALFIPITGLKATAIDMLVLVLMCLTVYLRKNVTVGKMLKGIFLYFFVSALLGGLMTSLFSLFNRIELLAKQTGIEEGIDVWIFALLAIVGSIFTLKGGKIFRSSSSKRTASLLIESDIGQKELRALVDSGNLATDPISGKSVIFVSVEKCKNIVDNDLYDFVKNNRNIYDIPITILSKIRMIPTRAVSGETLLPAVRFKNVSIKYGKNKKDIDVYIGLVNGENFGEYDAIISDETIA